MKPAVRPRESRTLAQSSHFSAQSRRQSSFAAVRTLPSCGGASGAAPSGGNSPLLGMQRFFLIKQPFPTELQPPPDAERCSQPFFRRKWPQSALSGSRPDRAAARCPRGWCGRSGGGSAGSWRSGEEPRGEGGRAPPGAGTRQRERARKRKEGAAQPGRERPREANGQPGRSHFLPQVPFQVQLPLEHLGSILRLIRLLLQTLDLPLDGFQGARRGHGRGGTAGGGCTWRRAAPRLSMGR